MNAQRWREFANRARLPEGACLRAVTDTVHRVNDLWCSLPEREVVPAKVLERIDAHCAADDRSSWHLCGLKALMNRNRDFGFHGRSHERNSGALVVSFPFYRG